MNKEQKRKLRNISLLTLLGLIGGTFAFTAFNQQAINDREGWNSEGGAGRIHDYYNSRTENKDVFVENYGDEPLLVRIQLKEFLSQNDESIVDDAERENLSSWTVWQPAVGNINNRLASSQSKAFERYTDWTFGFSHSGGDQPAEMASRGGVGTRSQAPYMPTFNHDRDSELTAAAGDARDYVDDGATHPGDGTDGYWKGHTSFQNYDPMYSGAEEQDRTPLFPGRPIEQEVKLTVEQERPPLTMTEWEELEGHEKVGRYWVVDEETGYAYWASYLQPGQATSYFIDQTDMADAIKERPGSWYYAILVQGNMVTPTEDNITSFFEEGGDTTRARDLVSRMGRTDIPNFNGDIHAGQNFFVEGMEYQYLGRHDQGHLVVPLHSIGQSSFGLSTNYMSSNVKQIVDNFYASLPRHFQSRVLPVSYGSDDPVPWEMITNPWDHYEVLQDSLTTVDERGERTAFVMSFADIRFAGRAGDVEPARKNPYPPVFPDFWSRTAVAGEDNKIWGFQPNEYEQWDSWAIDQPHDILPALILSQIGETPR